MDSASRMSLVFERPGSDIKKAGYLKKLKTMKKKFFLMRSTSSSGPARFEYYDSEKKFRNGQPPKRVIHLHTCFNINKKSDTRIKNAISLYTRDDCFSVIAENTMEQDHWLKFLLEYQTEYSDGITVPPRIHFDYVWQVTIKQRGLGYTIPGMSGTYRMCLSKSDICLVRNNSDLFEFTFQLSSIRRCGHSDGYFFMDVGRSAPTGEGELWIQVDDTVIAQSMHEVILSAMRTSSSSDQSHFRQRSSTNTSTINRPRDSSHDFNGQTALRPRTGSEGHRVQGQGSPRRRPMSSMVCRPSAGSMDNGTQQIIAGQNSIHSPHSFDTPGPPFYENQNMAHAPLSFPAQQGHRVRSDSTGSHGSRCSQLALSPDASLYGSSPGDQLSHRSMTPESMRPSIIEESSYFDMSPVAGVRSTTPSPPHPFTTDRVASEAITITGSSKHDGYIEMRPSSSLGSSVGGNDTGYMDMAINPPQLQDKVPGGSDNSYMIMGHHGNRQSSMSVPIPQRGPKEGYMDMNMTATSQPLPTVKEGGSGESCLPMTPTDMSPRSAVDLKPAKVVSYLSDDSMSGEFPKRAYSLGSRPVSSKIIHRHTHVPEPSIPLNLKVTDNGRSSSAPHLIVQKIKNQAAAYMPMDASSYSASVKSDDSDSFMELDFYRPRTASESYGYRPRASSFGKMYNTQGHRPRSSSYGHSSRGGKQMGSFESVRTTSKELLHKRSFESLGRFSTTSSKNSSSESLRKLETSSKSSQQSDYVDMNMNRNSEHSGYIDMSIGGEGQSAGSKCSGTSRSSSSQSLSSSPAVSGFISPSRAEKSLPDIKIIKASGHVVQKPIGFNPTHTGSSSHGTDGIPSQAALFSPVAFNSGSGGSRSPLVKGRSPASSGRESEEESYVPYQPASSDKIDTNLKGASGKNSSSSDSGRFSLRKKKHKSEKNEKKATEKQKKEKEISESKKFGRTSPKDGKHSPKSDSKFQKSASVQDDVYLAYEPGTTLSEESDKTAHVSNITKKPEPVQSYMPKSAQVIPTSSSDYMDFQPEVPKDSSVIKSSQSDISRKVKDSCEKSVEKTGRSKQDGCSPFPSSKSEHTESVVFSLGSTDDYMTHNPLSSGENQKELCDHLVANQEQEKTSTNLEGLAGESYQYMEFDPSTHQVQESEVDVKNPTRVRSFIAEKSMDKDFGDVGSYHASAKGQIVQGQTDKVGITDKVKEETDFSSSGSNKSILISPLLKEQQALAKVVTKQGSFENIKGNTIDKQKCDSPRAGKTVKSKDKPAERRLEIKSVVASVLPVHEEEEDDGYVGLDFSNNRKSGGASSEEPPPSSDIDNLRPLPVRSEICSLEGPFSKVTIKRLVSLPTSEDNKSEDSTGRLCRKASAPAIGQYNQKLASNVRMSPVRKGSVSSLGEESTNSKKEEGSSESVEGQANGATGTGQSPISSELHKQKSMPCMTLPVADEAPAPSVAIGMAGFFNSPRSRHSCSDLTGAYEQMTYPSGNNLESGHQQSSSQQQLTPPGCAQLNYASLDLGSSETVDSNDPKSPRIKSRHSSADEPASGPTLSYAQIDFKKSENLKSACNKDVLFSFD